MRDFPTLKLLDRFEKIFQHFGVDYKVMRRILQVKLLMDRRRVPTIFMQNANKKKGYEKKDRNHYLHSLWIYVFFSLFMIPFIIMGESYIFQMSLVYGLVTFMVMTSMISDFSSVLLDIRDRNILFTKPIDRKTINAAKMFHILCYLSLLTLAISGIPLLVGLLRHGIVFFLVSVVNIILLDLFIVVLTALFYMFILKFFDGEKLKDIINYVQIGFSLAIMIGYQFLTRSFELVDLTMSLEPAWWQLFIFPMWYGAIVELAVNGSFNSFYLLLAALGIMVPLLSFWLYIRSVPSFEKNLQKLSYHGKASEKKRTKFSEHLIKVICPADEERVFYRFAGIMLRNERDFKLKVYPSLGFSIVMPFIFLLNINGINGEGMADLSSSKSYLNMYFSLIIVPQVVMMLRYSGKYKGAWIYKAAPINELKSIFSGTMKAFLVKLYLPVYLLLSMVFIYLFGMRILPDVILMFINACLFAVVCFLLLKKSIPFSESFDTYSQGNGGILLGLILFVGVFAGLHYLSTLFVFGVYIYLLLAAAVLFLLWKHAFRLSWRNVGG
ncbi:hypothetical protein [Bacillus benzoevorans]|uniref:Uncharacterized protein n=1 Tax=Bacillus benzoevorans TaxID=1456 RepID=A0A7X0HNM0_9BACI|nr:hypothetical protein [Bacillus benzoevorans]MBB6444024.1 hypothetical protein [Bacillus benzoevorans]